MFARLADPYLDEQNLKNQLVLLRHCLNDPECESLEAADISKVLQAFINKMNSKLQQPGDQSNQRQVFGLLRRIEKVFSAKEVEHSLEKLQLSIY